MEHLLFACNAVLPTFALILLGVGLKKIGILQDALIRQGNTLCFQVLFPVLVFLNLYTTEKVDLSYLKLIRIALAIIGVSLLLLLWVVPRAVPEPKRRAVLVQSIYRGNYMLYGLPFSKTLGGNTGAAMATSIMAVTLPVLNVIGVFVYSYFSDGKEKPNLKHTAAEALKNPILWGVVIGFTFRMLPVPLPEFLYTAGMDLAGVATPLAFLLLGGQFHLSSAGKNRKALTVGLGAKLIVLPAVVLYILIDWMGITGAALVPLFIFVAAPTAITNYQMAIQFDADAELAGDFLIYSMLFSIPTMVIFIYLLRCGGWI